MIVVRKSGFYPARLYPEFEKVYNGSIPPRLEIQSMPTLSHPIASGRTAEVFAWEDQTILKLYRIEFPTQWVDYEASIGRQVCAAGVRAPAVLDLVEIEGRRGIVYERIQGESMIVQLARQPWKLISLARALAELHANLHRHPLSQLSPLREQIQRSIEAAPALPKETKEPLLKILSGLPDGDRLCHGDFHPGNVIMTAEGPVIIDWMTASCGNPWADVARTQLLLTAADVPQGTPGRSLILTARKFFHRAYLKSYFDLIPDGREQLPAWLTIMAAARMNENIIPEQDRLLEIIRGGLGA
jgi:uncharacterized protein (TIGR02172 family)